MTKANQSIRDAAAVSRRTVLKQAGAAAGVAALGLPAGQAGAQEKAKLPEPVAALIDKARSEPEAVIFGLSIPADRSSQLRQALDDFYGFPLKVQFLGGLGPQKAAEVAQLVSRGVPAKVDCFYAGEGSTIFLRKAGAVETDNWASALGIPPERLVDGASVKVIDSSLPLMSYNKALVKEDELPKAWEDLLDPRWKGKITAPRLPSAAFFYNTYSVGEEKMTRILEGIMTQNVIWVPRTPDGATRLLSGEASLALGVDIESQVIRGAPLAYVPISPMFLAPWQTNIVKGTRSPNLVKLFAYFISTDIGQAALDNATGYSTIDRPDSTKAKLLAQYKPTYVPQEWIQQNYERIVAKYSAIMGIR